MRSSRVNSILTIPRPWRKLTTTILLSTLLQGGPLGGGEDPYWDAGRLGGTLSHVAREHPPTGAPASGSIVL